MPTRYRVFVSEQVFTVLPVLDRKSRALIRRFIIGLGQEPNRKGDYTESDDAGRPIELVVIEGYAVLFWTDHAVAEIKVLEIRSAD